MSAKCAKCSKTVYRAEELKCLDQSWHKPCFKCTECGMVLTMKNYKGFNKQPYCSAHYPQLKATTVESTPEQDRLRKNTELSSGKNYRKDFEENIVGHVTAVADDPESQRQRNLGNMRGINYTGGQQRLPSVSSVPSASSYPEPDDNEPVQSPGYRPPGAQPVIPAPPPGRQQGIMYRALYDYEAQDQDEVSFNDGDNIIDAEIIDDGWIMGTIESTGQRGMIPFNYVEEA
jgi:hypothetical protein